MATPLTNLKNIMNPAFRRTYTLILCFASIIFNPCLLVKGEDKNIPDTSNSTSVQSPNLTQKKEIDLGDGVVLKEIRVKDEKGRMKMNLNILLLNGKNLMVSGCNETRKNSSGKTFTRTLWQGDKVIFSEEDEDGDHVPDTLVFYDETCMPWKVFHEQSDGTLAPLKSEEIRQLRKDWESAMNIMTPVFESTKKPMNEKERKKIIQDAIDKAKKGNNRIK